MQYTAYKEMLLDFTAGKYFPVECLKLNPNGGAEINYSAFFSYNASEAYLFMPSGYWPSVYDNTMYPSDFPTDILASMNDGEQKYVIKGTSTDGQYLMLFCINDMWYKTTYAVSNGKVISFNEFSIEDEADDAIIYTDSIKVKSSIEVNPAHFSDMPTSMYIIKNVAYDVDTSIYVKEFGKEELPTEAFIVYKSNSDIKTSLMIYSVYDVSTSCDIYEYGHSDIDTEAYIRAFGSSSVRTRFLLAAGDESCIKTETYVNERRVHDVKTSFTIKVYKSQNIPTSFTIKKYLDDSIETDAYILANLKKDIYTSFAIVVWSDKKYIPITFSVKKTSENNLPTSINILELKNDNIASSFEILPVNNELNINTEFILKIHNESDIKTSFTVIPLNRMEATSDNKILGNTYDISTDFTIADCSLYELPTSFAINFTNLFNVIGQEVITHYKQDIQTQFEIKEDAFDQIHTSFAITSQNVMNTVASDVLTKQSDDIYTEFEIKHQESNDLRTSFAITITNTMEIATEDYIIKNTSDIPTDIEIVFTGHSDTYTTFVLQAYNTMAARMEYNNPQFSDIMTQFALPEVNDILTTFYIGPVNTMETTSMSYPPCKKIVFTDIIKDSTGYSKTPATNFGSISDIYVGNKHNVKTGQLEHYKSIIGFDTSDTNTDRPFDADYFKYNMVIKAELKLFINRKTTEDIVIDIHQVDYDSWDEYRIAYKDINKMPTTKYVNTVVVPAGSYGYFKFDVTPSFDNWNKIGDKFSFVLTSDTVTGKEILSMSSKEGYYTPQLVLLHYKFYPFADNSDLKSTLEINPEERISTSFDLISIFEELLDTEFEIEENTLDDMIPTSITIAGMTFEESDIPTTWDMIFYPDEDNLKTLFEVNFTNAESELKTDFEIERDYSYGCYVIII